MKKRVLSLFMALALCLTMLPTAALAEEAGAAPDTGNVESVYTIGDDTVVQIGEESDPVQVAQALIDALPEDVTAENAEEIEQQLMALEAALEALTEEQLALLDMTRYEALCAALVSQVSLTAERGGEHADHPICGDASCNKHGASLTDWVGVSELSDDMKEGYYYLTGPVTRTSTWYPKDGVVLCLNGYNISMDAKNSNNDSTICVNGGVTFTLCDCQNKGTVTHGMNGTAKYIGSGVWVESGNGAGKANFVLYSGSVSGNEYDNFCAGVHVGANANFTMHGGSISGNKTAGYGGGVSVQAGSASFTMTGGTIAGNNAGRDGGGVYVKNGAFTMTGGSITGNTVGSGYNGGGVYAGMDANITLSGAPIITRNNDTSSKANNVYHKKDEVYGVGKTLIGKGGLSSTASIGVTVDAGRMPTTDGGYTTIAEAAEGYTITADDAKRVSADAGTGYSVRQKDNALVLVKGELPHEHPICGAAHKDINGHTGACADVTWTAWDGVSDITYDENNTAYVYLTTNAERTSTLEIAQGNTLYLCLNGHSITTNKSSSVVTVGNDATFSLCDCKDGGKLTHGMYTSSSRYSGHGVHLTGSKGTFNMYGGNITGNRASYGGGVTIDKEYSNATFNLYGGSITDNATTGGDGGGGVHALFGTFTMYGGSITGNNAKNANFGGGGVYAGSRTGKFYMKGGSITGNTAKNGGGVYVYQSSEFYVSGSVDITGNKNTLGIDENVYLRSGASFEIDTDGLKADAKIGVTYAGTIAAGDHVTIAKGANKGYTEGNITSDQGSDYTIKREGDDVNLYYGLHEHCICGGDTCTGVGHTCDEKVTFKAWSGASGKLPTESGYYYLTDNMTLTTEWEPSEGSNIVLCLNGKTITAKVGTQDSASLTHDSIDIRKGVTVSVTDCVGTGTISRSTYYQRAVNVWGGTFNLYGGKITGFKVDSTSGGGVGIASNGIFNMYGGAITKNTSSYGGGGVHVGYFNSDAGTFNMYGGSITGNTSSRDGAGVRVSRNATMTISGNVKITGNKVGTAANNVYLPRNTTITVTGPLTGGENSIGVTTADLLTKDGSFIAVANGTDSYTLTDNEKNAFSEDDENRFNTKLLRDNTILFTRFVDVQMHDHALCGASCNHETAHSSELWQPLTYYASSQDLYCGPAQASRSTESRYNADNPTRVSYYSYTIPSGNYYLTEDLTLGGDGSSITGGVLMIEGDVKLCLNGKTLSTTTTAYLVNVIKVDAGGSLTLCDCSTAGSGKITSENKVYTCVQPVGGQNTGKASGKFTMYGGTLTGAYYGVALNDADSVALYGGTITGNTVGVSATYPVTIGGTVNITGNTNADARLLNKNTGTGLIKIDPSLTQDSHIGVSSEQELSETITSIKIATGATNPALDYTKIFTPDVTDQDYVITKNNEGDLYLTVHTHEWEYTLSEDKATITVTCSNTDGHCPTPAGGSVTIIKPAHTVYGDNQNEKATTSSTLISSIRVPTIVYSKDGQTLPYTPVSAGEYTASITLGGTTASVNYTVEKATLTADDFTYAAPTDLIYDGKTRWPNIDPKVGGVDDYYWSYYDASGNKVSSSGLNVGTYQLHIRVTETENYKAVADLTSADWTFDILPRAITVTVDETSRRYGDPDPDFTVQVTTGALAGRDDIASLGLALTSTADKKSSVASYDVTGLANNPNYIVAIEGTNKLTVTPRPISLTITPVTYYYGDTGVSFTPSLTIVSGSLAEGDTLKALKPSWSGGGTSKVGTFDVNVFSWGNSNYNVTFDGTDKLIVQPRPITVTVNEVTRTYGEENPTFTAQVTGGKGFVGSDNVESLGLSLTTDATATSPVGSYNVTGTASNGNYAVTVVGKDALTVTAKAITVTVTPVTRAYGDANPAFTATVPSGALVGEDTVESLNLTLSSTATTTSDVRSYDVTGSANNRNYEVTIDGANKLTVTKKELTENDLEFAGTPITKVYDGKTDATVTVQIKDSAKVKAEDVLPDVTGIGTYNSKDVKDASMVTFVTAKTESANYILPANLTREHEASITKRVISIKSVTTAPKQYDRDTNAWSCITDVSFDNLVSGETLTKSKDYGITEATFNSADVELANTITGEVGITNPNLNYTFKESGKETSTAPFTTTGSITPANSWSLTPVTDLTIRYNNRDLRTYTPNWSTLLPSGQTWTYSASTATTGSAALSTNTIGADTGVLSYQLSAGNVGDTATWTVTASCANYQSFTLAVTLTLIARDEQTGFKFENNTTSVTKTYGDEDFTIAASGGATGSSVTYTSSDETVAKVDEDGKVTIVGAGITTIKAKASETADFEEKEISYTLTVKPKTLAKDDLTYSGSITKVYDGSTNAPSGLTVSVDPSSLVNGDTLTVNGTLKFNSANVGEASEITFIPTAITTGNYTLAATEALTIRSASITAKEVTLTSGINATNRSYAKDNKTVALTKGTLAFTGLVSGETLDVNIPDTGTIFDTKVGTYNVTYSGVTLKDGTTGKASNYKLVGSLPTVTVTISKAAAPVLADIPVSFKYTVTTGEKAIGNAGIPADAGTLTYSKGTATKTGTVTVTSWDVDSTTGKVTYTLSGGKAGDSATLFVTIASTNYEDATVNVVITLTARDNQVELRITGGTTVVYGQTLALNTSGGSGSGAVTYTVVNGTGEATIDPNTGVLTPVKVGSVSVIATKAGDNDYNAVTSAPVEITITKATPTGEPKYTEIKTGGKTLADAALTIEGSTLKPNAGTLEWVDDKGNVLSNDTKVEANTTYKWRFTPTDGNYTVLTGSIELYHKSSSGGSGWYYTYYTIKATAGTNGSISPSGWTSVRDGRDQTFTITPDKGYAVAKVLVDGKSVGAVKSYTFKNVTKDHTIEAIFMKSNGNPQTGVFVDVAEGSYYEEAIDWAVEKGITNGVSSNMFAPNDPCTRAQIVTFLWRAAGSPAPKSMSSFTDVPADAFYAKAVAWAVENGITSGTGESKFSPNSTCTRAQAVTFLYRASGSPAVSGKAEFSDVSTTAFYADAVAWAAKKGITTGIGGGLFGSDNDCTRGQIVTFLWRAMAE